MNITDLKENILIKLIIVDYLEKQISEEFTIDVAKELVPFVKKLLKYTLQFNTD